MLIRMVLVAWLPAVPAIARPGPFDGRTFHGRIAFSSDGNFNDEDDWGAFPVAMAMLDAFDVVHRLVHVDYNNILPRNDVRFYREMTESVLGAAQRFGVSAGRMFDCQTDLTGDEDANLDKVRGVLAGRLIPTPTDPRASIRLEAENFRTLDGAEVEYVNDRKASKRMSVRGTGEGAHRIETLFVEPYTAVEGRYDIAVRLFDRKGSEETYRLLVQGGPQGRPWRAPGTGSRWVTHTLHDVPVRAGDSIGVDVSDTGSDSFKLDYIQLTRR